MDFEEKNLVSGGAEENVDGRGFVVAVVKTKASVVKTTF